MLAHFLSPLVRLSPLLGQQTLHPVLIIAQVTTPSVSRVIQAIIIIILLSKKNIFYEICELMPMFTTSELFWEKYDLRGRELGQSESPRL